MNLLPSLHPATVHFPIAFLLLASGLLWLHLLRRFSFDLRPTIWLLLATGWVGGAVAVLTGLLAQSALPPDAPYRAILNWHIGAGLAALVLYGGLLYAGWLYRSPRARRRRRDEKATDLLDDPAVRSWLGWVALLGALLIVAAGWNGGVLVYEFGVNVQEQPAGP